MIRLLRSFIGRLKKSYAEVMELPDSPKKIAQGVALGIALDFLPLPFVSIPISFILAKLIRVNAAAAVLTVIFFKWAVPFFFTLDYYVGKALLGGGPPQGMNRQVALLEFSAWMQWIKELGQPFLLGALINACVFGVAAYFVAKALLDGRRKKKAARLKPPRPVKSHRPRLR